MEPDFQIFHIPDPNKCVFGPGDAWACPRIYRFILKSENVGQTISDPGQKLIVYTLPSIWQYPFFQNAIKMKLFCQNRHPQQIRFFWYCIGYGYLGRTPLVWLGGPGSWAGPFWFGLGGPGPGPDPFGLAWGARVLGRTGLYD